MKWHLASGISGGGKRKKSRLTTHTINPPQPPKYLYPNRPPLDTMASTGRLRTLSGTPALPITVIRPSKEETIMNRPGNLGSAEKKVGNVKNV